MKLVLILAFALASLPLFAAESTHPKIIKQYDIVRAALVADDLSAAKKAATNLATAAQEESVTELQVPIKKLTDSTSLKEARAAFQSISLVLEKWVKGQKGFFIVTCPMIKDSVWIQTTDKIGNPYAGQEMPECGQIQK